MDTQNEFTTELNELLNYLMDHPEDFTEDEEKEVMQRFQDEQEMDLVLV